MEPLKVGAKAPDFALSDKDGKTYILSKMKAEHYVIYFYPKDDTPGCTLEAQSFTRDLKGYQKINTQVIGISGGDSKSKEKFCKKHKLEVLLLSDTNHRVSESYGVVGEKSFMGRKYLGIGRTTFVLDKNKKIIKVFENVVPINHSQEILSFLSKP